MFTWLWERFGPVGSTTRWAARVYQQLRSKYPDAIESAIYLMMLEIRYSRPSDSDVMLKVIPHLKEVNSLSNLVFEILLTEGTRPPLSYRGVWEFQQQIKEGLSKQGLSNDVIGISDDVIGGSEDVS